MTFETFEFPAGHHGRFYRKRDVDEAIAALHAKLDAVEALQAKNEGRIKHIVDEHLQARITQLEQALRLHLAVSPDDPVLIEPIERRVLQLEGALKGMIPRFIELMNFYKRTQGSAWTADFDIALQHAQQALGENPVKS